MNSARETSLARLPRSGDKLVDWIFKQFVFFLRRETLQVRRKRRLVFDNRHRQALWGLLDSSGPPSHKVSIGINAAKSRHANRDEELSTLIHEMSHIVCTNTQDKFIYQLEGIMLRRLTQEQKNYLKSFIPRHEVKSV
jgi:hypothetical protein